VIVTVHILLISAIVWIIFRKTSTSPIRRHYFTALVLKLSAGIILGVIYFNHYKSGDTLIFHETAVKVIQLSSRSDAEYLSFLVHGPDEMLKETNPVLNEPRSAFFIRFLSILYLLTSSNYWLTGVYLSLLSFSGAWILTNTIIKCDQGMKLPALAGLLYLPTFVFWTSGVLKESMAWFCIAMLIGYFLDYKRDRYISVWRIVATIVMIYVLWNIKYYYMAVLVLCLGPLWLYVFLQNQYKKNLQFYFVYIGAILFIGTILTFLHPNFSPARILNLIHENHLIMLDRSAPGHAIRFFKAEDPFLNFIINIPVSLSGGLFMPLLWQGVNFFARVTGLINTVLLVFFIVKLIEVFRSGHHPISILGISVAIYIVVLAILLAYTTPNFGTLERYKTSYIAFFTLWVLYENPLFMRIFRTGKH